MYFTFNCTVQKCKLRLTVQKGTLSLSVQKGTLSLSVQKGTMTNLKSVHITVHKCTYNRPKGYNDQSKECMFDCPEVYI